MLTAKWGLDGFTVGNLQQPWQTQPSATRSNIVSEESVFATSLVPLQIKGATSGETLWLNPSPSSPRYCRPLKFEYIKEDPETTTREYERVVAEWQANKTIEITAEDRVLRVSCLHSIQLCAAEKFPIPGKYFNFFFAGHN